MTRLPSHHTAQASTAYWIWAGITEKDAAPDHALYIYQGVFTPYHASIDYQHKGLHPYPAHAPAVYLVYRLKDELPDPDLMVKIFKTQAMHWQGHGVQIIGIQLDFDSPTAKLLTYGHFLEDFRHILPAHYRLSVTGLGDWIINAKKSDLRVISKHVDEIVFQLYQGRHDLPTMTPYFDRLKSYPTPFKIGLLQQNDYTAKIHLLEKNKNFKGIIYFIQK
jgi:hypothetical protein